MLSELHISNFAIIDDLRVSFGAGLNVLTGETGAGKSIIIDAVDMLLGCRVGQEVIRADASRTQVEGFFLLDSPSATAVEALLEREGLEGDDEHLLTLSRELRRGGRSVARVNGRSVSLAVLREIGNHLVDIHGQTDHLSLMRQREHINLLDRYADLAIPRAEVSAAVRKLIAVRKELATLRHDQRELARRLDLLNFQVEEIQTAALEPGEGKALEAERRRLANAEQLIRLTDSSRRFLVEGNDEQAAALDLVSNASGELARLASIDPDTESLLQNAESLNDQLDDLARSLEVYASQVEFNPERLVEVEERLNLIFNLKRKYGDTIEEIIAFGERAHSELLALNNAEVRTAELEEEENRLRIRIGQLGATLSRTRRQVAEAMAAAVERELHDLRMARARFSVEFQWSEDSEGAVVTEDDTPQNLPPGCYAFDSNGLDRVEFLVTANPGEPLKPLVKVASGGETSRLMLALKTVLGRADETPTLIFDEIDVGIGGRVGATVGQKLWGLTHLQSDRSTAQLQGKDSHAANHQVLCITHLPQLAAYGDTHFTIRKLVVDQHTRTDVVKLSGDERVQELAAMLGSSTDAGRESVTEMLAEVAEVKPLCPPPRRFD
ncbi:MAG: DNA repair protein RecN [Chloroflexota bacterium]|nr:DNA repair protein RecN [Chloroflexota bacterium]